MDFAGCLVRLAGHDLMDFRREARVNRRRGRSFVRPGAAKAEGGSDGCVNFEDEDNKGLPTCLMKSGIDNVFAEHCDKVSMADFMVIAAEAITGKLAVDYDASEPFKSGTLAARFRDQFRAGRTTLKECPENKGLMPNPERGCTDL